MAKSFIKQILNITGIKTPDANGYYDPSVYKPEPVPEQAASGPTENKPSAETQLTGVEKYLANKYPQPQEQAETVSGESSELTGVAKYLAKKQQEAEQKSAEKAAALANMTGVARYLAKLEGGKETVAKQASPAPKKQVVDTAKLTGVEKYLAQQQKAPASPCLGQEKPKPAMNKPSSAPKPKAEEKAKSVQPATSQTLEPVAEKTTKTVDVAAEKPVVQAPVGDDLLNLADNVSQCQAATTKGTQCRRKTGLETLETSFNDRRYRFAVCSQHNNENFTPFSKFVSED